MLPRRARRVIARACTLATRSRSLSTLSPIVLPRDTNQALALGEYAHVFLNDTGEDIDGSVYQRVQMFHTDSVMCGLSALALKTNAPTILRAEALEYQTTTGACVFGSSTRVSPEKAVVANCSAVREWDSNGTVFGFRANTPGHQAGEFGHNDFYPVVLAVNATIV